MVDFINSSAAQRTIVLSLAACMIAASFAGCRCRQQQPCVPQQYTPYNAAPAYSAPGSGTTQGYAAPTYNTAPAYNNGFGFNNANRRVNSATQARIAAPATYSLNIPGVNNNLNNNLNGTRVGQLPSGLLNTGQNAPTPANRPANYNQSQGWRQSNGANLNTSSTGQTGSSNRVANASSATSVLDSSTRLNNPNGGSVARTASLNNANASGASGVSFTQSNDYRTTSIDERRDNTRLPVTDATNVRGTTPFAQNQTGSGQYVQPYYEPRQQNQQRYAAPASTVYQGAFAQPNNTNYNGLPASQNYQGRFDQRYSSAQPQRQVLAQSTARLDPFESTASNTSSDWRDRGRQSY